MNMDSDRLFNRERYEFLINTVGKDKIDDADLGRFRLLINSWFSHHEMAYFDIQDGTLPKTFEPPLIYRLFTTFEIHEDVRELWRTDLRYYYTEEFQKWVDKLLEEDLTGRYETSVYRRSVEDSLME
jgi:hypothetical protein